MIAGMYKGYRISLTVTMMNQDSYERPPFTIYKRREHDWELVYSDKGDVSERHSDLDAAQNAAIALAHKWVDEQGKYY